MKVLNLQCAHAHGFEGWFGSEDDYQSQRARGLVSCPMCGDAQIVKLPSAPRLNLGATAPSQAPSPAHTHQTGPSGMTAAGGNDAGGATGEASVVSTHAPHASPSSSAPSPSAWPLQHMQAALMQAVHHVLAHTEDVGSQFADEARKMHYGETEARGIRGQVTREETEALLDEGIEVMALPALESLKGPLQ